MLQTVGAVGDNLGWPLHRLRPPCHLRTLSPKGGGTIVEVQVARDENTMAYTYAILECPLPVDGYKSTLSVAPVGKGSKLTWTGNFKAKGAPDAKAEEVVAGTYEGGLKGIANKAK